MFHTPAHKFVASNKPAALTVNEDNHGGARVIIDGRKANVASVRSYSIYCGDSEEEILADIERAKKNHWPLVWINLESAVICSDRGFYEREAALWADAPRLSVGDTIEFEGQVYTIGTAPNRNFSLTAV